MHALVRAAVAVALLAAVGAPAATPHTLAPPREAASAAASGRDADRPCPPGTVPDTPPFAARPSACLPLPRDAARGARLGRLASGPPARAELRIGDAEEWIARMPDRPADFELYELPVAAFELASEASAEPGAPPRGVSFELGTSVTVQSLELEGQIAATRVALVGELYGITVVTLHRVQDTDGEQSYALVHGRLSRPGPGVVAGAELARGAVVGYAGEEDAPGELYFEVRKLAREATLGRHLSSLLQPSVSVPCDPRNVLARR
ncbi:MAG: hypothetical protein IT373_36595 [Polyangiaceae bacterium]|nr:hypothetical protein [Polyangiaceae bacterium]